MAVVHISKAPGREQYDLVRQFLDPEELRSHGLLFHTASELPSGEIRIVDVYADDDARQRASERVFAAFADAGVTEMVAAGPQPEVSQTFELVR